MIQHGLTYDEYDAIDGVRHGTLRHMEKSALAYKFALDAESKDTQPLIFGRLAHITVLEPHRLDAELAAFDESHVLYDGPVRRGKKFDQFVLDHADKTIMIASERDEWLQHHTNAVAVRDAIHSHPEASKLLADGRPEVVVTAELDGHTCKARVDWVPPRGPLVELKTTKDAAHDKFGRDAANYGYHTGAAFYGGVWTAATQEERDVALLVVESKPPHDIAVRYVVGAVLERGQDLCRSWLRRLRESVDSGAWPGVCATSEPLYLPPWAMQDRDRELEI